MTGLAIILSNIVKRFGDFVALNDVSLAVEPGEFMTLVGPSGCGKSTLLRLIAGFEPQSSGTIAIGGQGVDHLRPKERGVAMVFQHYALYPHMTVFDNLAMPLVMQQLSFMQRVPLLGRLMPESRRRMVRIADDVARVAEALEIVPLLKRRPGQLSGGQRQRVALGRAMVRKPRIFLMDEPLSNLDARLRVQMRDELTELHRKIGATFIYVTHDQAEAMTMSHRIAVMMDSEIVQVGTPAEIYERPADIRVARFIGTPEINLFQADVDAIGGLILFGRPVPLHTGLQAGARPTVGIRSEDVEITHREASGEGHSIGASVRRVENLGNEMLLYLDPVQDDGGSLVVRSPARSHAAAENFDPGSSVCVSFPTERLYLFDADGKHLPAATELHVDAARARGES